MEINNNYHAINKKDIKERRSVFLFDSILSVRPRYEAITINISDLIYFKDFFCNKLPFRVLLYPLVREHFQFHFFFMRKFGSIGGLWIRQKSPGGNTCDTSTLWADLIWERFSLESVKFFQLSRALSLLVQFFC